MTLRRTHPLRRVIPVLPSIANGDGTRQQLPPLVLLDAPDERPAATTASTNNDSNAKKKADDNDNDTAAAAAADDDNQSKSSQSNDGAKSGALGGIAYCDLARVEAHTLKSSWYETQRVCASVIHSVLQE